MNELSQQVYGERPMAMNQVDAQQPTPCPSENKIRTFMVRQLNHGYTVEVGCHTFAVETPEKLILKLSEYINNPSATEEKWFKGNLF